MTVMDCIIAAIWFSILTAVICFGIHLLIVHVRYKDKVSVARIILGIVLVVALVLWCGVTAVVWHFDSKQEQKRVEYESRLREPGVDQNGNLWIIAETENNDDIYSYEKGDDILKLIESFENAKSYNVLGISIPYPVQHNWCYQPIDCGECELYKVIRSVGGSQKTVIKYCISVDEDGNIFQTEERGEQPWWVLVSSYKKEIDSVVEEKDGTKKNRG